MFKAASTVAGISLHFERSSSVARLYFTQPIMSDWVMSKKKGWFNIAITAAKDIAPKVQYKNNTENVKPVISQERFTAVVDTATAVADTVTAAVDTAVADTFTAVVDTAVTVVDTVGKVQ